MTKIIACGLIIAVGWFLGGIYADFKQKSYLELCGIISLLESIKNAISYSRAELYGIFAGFSDKALDSCGFTGNLKSTDTIPASELWRSALDKLSVNAGIKDVLSSFGSTLGSLDYDTQIERLESCMAFPR
jgi:Stage III sporulation protein AB (spore_III_AB).